MKRIVLSYDGTWNKPADENLPANAQTETNVSRFYRSIQDQGPDGNAQVKWYDEGVGSHWYDRFAGGMLGAGLEHNIVQGYRFLAEQYDEGDEIYVLGFSRGAYTARSLVGMLRNCGLVKKGGLSDVRVAMAYGVYRTRDDGPDSWTARAFRARFAREVPVKFLGVWDTVGALGIPLDLVEGLNMKFYEFHDTRLSNIVENAYHAVAIDEHRKNYDVCLWDPAEAPAQTIEQRWFIGAHSDVGGGYEDRCLSDLALRWMQEKAAALGLGITPADLTEDGYKTACSDSYAQFLGGKYSKPYPRHYRAIGTTRFGNEVLDDSARRRWLADATYRPENAGFKVDAGNAGTADLAPA